MTTLLTALMIFFSAMPAAGAAAAQTVAPVASTGVTIELDRAAFSADIGQRLSFTSTIRNNTDQPVRGAVVHLNVLGLDPSVYVDPEDWSAERTTFLATLPPGGSVQRVWPVQAVNTGPILLYVTLVTDHGNNDVVASPALRLSVVGRPTVDGGGILPVAIGVPILALLVIGLLVHLRRRSRARMSAEDRLANRETGARSGIPS